MVAYLKGEHGVSHGYANGIVLQYRSRDAATSDDDLGGCPVRRAESRRFVPSMKP